MGEDFVITVRHGGKPDLDEARQRLEGDPELLHRGSEAILHVILDQVVDEYGPVVVGLGRDIEELETEIILEATCPLAPSRRKLFSLNLPLGRLPRRLLGFPKRRLEWWPVPKESAT